MSHLSHTFLLMTLCLVCATSAFAKQREMGPVFPSSLRNAIDTSETSTPWRAGVKTNVPRRRAPDPASVESATNRKKSSKPMPTRKVSHPTTQKTIDPANKWPANQRSSNIATPFPRSNATTTPPNPLTPFPRAQTAPNSRAPFTNELTPFPRHRLPNGVVRLKQPENFARGFGTVMTFPASQTTDESTNNVVRQPGQSRNTGLNQPGRQPPQVIWASVIGPETLIQDIPDLFEIEVSNTSGQTANNIVVQMGVSEYLTITDFDRQAWLDGENRTVSWKIDGLQSGFKDVIRFRAVSATLGSHNQTLSVGMENTFQGQTGFVANVIQNQDNQNLDSQPPQLSQIEN